MANPVVQVKGGRELRATLQAAGSDLSELKETHLKVAGIVAGRAKQLAPKVTGTMAGTIRPAGTKRAAIVRAGYKRTPYAGPNEWGWPEQAQGIKGSFSGDHWLTKAAKDTEQAWVGIYTNEVNHALSKIKGA